MNPTDAPFNITEGLQKYPKILDYSPKYAGLRGAVAFEKHDGSNIMWLWDGRGFGAPRFRSGRLVSEEWVAFVQDVEPSVLRPPEAAARALSGASDGAFFSEFRGDKSFSGLHVPGDPKRAHPIDLWVGGRGFMPPAEFSRVFGVPTVYSGTLTAKFVEDVRSGRLGVNEGVVVKGGDWGSVWCCKIKTREWLARGGEA